MVLWIFIITTGFILNVNAFKISVDNVRFGSFILIELLFDLLFVHDCSAGSIAIGSLILTFVGVVTILKAALAANHSRPLSVLLFHFIIDKYKVLAKIQLDSRA